MNDTQSFQQTSSSSVPPERLALRRQDRPAKLWDEGLPCGNGLLGSLLWGEPIALNVSLDCTELWDCRAVPEFTSEDYRFSFVKEHVRQGELGPLRKMIEDPYGSRSWPTRLPGARLVLSFPGEKWAAGHLDFIKAEACQTWESGRKVVCSVLANHRVGLVRVEGAQPESVRLLNPFEPGAYDLPDDVLSHFPTSDLGYPETVPHKGENWTGFVQETCDKNSYAIVVQWEVTTEGWLGAWTIATGCENPLKAALEITAEALKTELWVMEHYRWWDAYWQRTSIDLEDDIVAGAWYFNRYLFASSGREGCPPITLQGPWTADHGFLPPWKGDYHHNLNTQYSYYQCFMGNQLDGVRAFLDWLWSIKEGSEAWTARFFEAPGLNVPMSTDIEGKPVGGWHQHSHNVTSGGWLAHFFYLYWKYSGDRDFLEKRAYPWLRDCAIFLEAHTIFDENGSRVLPLSSSPEIHDNNLEAWFPSTVTQYDLVIIRFVFERAAELAQELGKTEESARWKKCLSECLPVMVNQGQELLLARGIVLHESHRHHAHLMSIHPFESVRWTDGGTSMEIIRSSLAALAKLGTWEWVGYSWSWRAIMYALAQDGDSASKDLHLFLRACCSVNGFHLNGDQTGEGHCKWTYRPFTLEGNFACAVAIQYMLMQCHDGVIHFFPALPTKIENARFKGFRAEGGWIVSATHEGEVTSFAISGDQGGRISVANPFGEKRFEISGIGKHAWKRIGGNIWFDVNRGETVSAKVI